MRKYLADIGAKGGKRSTPAKSAANSENGKKGGWPKGKPRKSIPLDERSKKVKGMKEAGTIKPAKPYTVQDLENAPIAWECNRRWATDEQAEESKDQKSRVQPDEYSQEMPSYEND